MRRERTRVGLVGLFDSPDDLLRAARRLRDAGWRRWDCHVPYPIHGLPEAMGLGPSPVGRITLGVGLFGACLALLMQGWMSAVDYPVRIGGKPLFSWPAFIPITFELFVLFGALATSVALVACCRLWRWHSPLYDAGVMAEVTSRRFAVVLDHRDDLFEEQAVRRLLEEMGCKDIRDLYDEGESSEHGQGNGEVEA